MKEKYVERVTEYKTREKALMQQLKHSEENVVELIQEIAVMQHARIVQ